MNELYEADLAPAARPSLAAGRVSAKAITIGFAPNDDMALGAVDALNAAGVKPGQDILGHLDRRHPGRG